MDNQPELPQPAQASVGQVGIAITNNTEVIPPSHLKPHTPEAT